MIDRQRRRLLSSVLYGVASIGLAGISKPVLANTGLLYPETYASDQDTAAFWAQPRTLNLYRPSTGEHCDCCYWRDGHIERAGYLEICRILRDARAGQSVAMDLQLLNLLRGQQGWLELAYGMREPYHINSGYRTKHTNETTEGAAKDSMHTRGMAADGRYPTLPIEYQGRLIAAFKGGGVGFYLNRQGFIHSDVGRLRYWVKK